MTLLSHTLYFLATIYGPKVDDNFNYSPPDPIVNQDTSINDIFNSVAGWLTSFVGTIAVILIIVGGIQYAMAMGDQEKIHTAKRTLYWAVGGAVLALLSYILVPIVAKLFQ